MKKLSLLMVLVFVGFTSFAQTNDGGQTDTSGLRLGANVGIPLGNFSDYYNLVLNLDVEYDWEIGDPFQVGVGSGWTCFMGEDDIDNFEYIPLYGSADVDITDQFSGGIDLGYAIGLNDGSDGEFLWRVQLSYSFNDRWDVRARYANVGSDLSYIGVGTGFNF